MPNLRGLRRSAEDGALNGPDDSHLHPERPPGRRARLRRLVGRACRGSERNARGARCTRRMGSESPARAVLLLNADLALLRQFDAEERFAAEPPGLRREELPNLVRYVDLLG